MQGRCAPLCERTSQGGRGISSRGRCPTVAGCRAGFQAGNGKNRMFFFVRAQYFPVSDVYIGKVLLKFYNDEENFVCNGGGRVTGF